jgi:phenylpropionate dioxygenase-like ring-hydroxylating dioxygenase large terminal subunit
MPHYPKPAEGSWTEHYPELGTAPVSYADSTSPEFYEREREAIFRRTWLNVGRVEQLRRKGSYFTRDIDSAGTSIVIVRGLDDEVRAFHNICRHRGNKLVWQDYPQDETNGACRQFQCKYHAWRYDLAGNLTFVQQEEEFFGLDKGDYGLASVRCEVWEGWIFVNFDDTDTRSNARCAAVCSGRGTRPISASPRCRRGSIRRVISTGVRTVSSSSRTS